jgi:Asp-tRNA(Asn)/Glu-tRNA(Gln) amidotransferase A subunit family amidase
MVPLALGTQTLGSVLRPASFCGVTGFKPSYGLLPMDGVLPCAASLDTLGLFTHRAADVLALWDILGYPTDDDGGVVIGVRESMPGVEPAMAAAVDRAVTTLRAAGVSIVPIDIGAELTTAGAAARIVLAYEAARFHEERFHEYGDRMQDMGELVREGLATPTARYDEARRRIATARMRMWAQFAATPVILGPAAPGPAPRGLTSTGDPVMNAPWTAIGSPAISIPLPVGEELPLGLQLTAGHGNDAILLHAAVRVERILQKEIED